MAGGTGKIVHQMRQVAGTGSQIDWKTVTASGVDTKGTPAELVASLPAAVQFVKVFVAGTQVITTDTSMLLDIMTDTGGGDVVRIPDIGCGFIYPAGLSGSSRPPRSWGFPLAIPSGAQVLARLASAVSGDTAEVAMDFYGGFPAAAGDPDDDIDTLGIPATPTGSHGVNLTTGATAHNWPLTWTEIEDSTPNAYRALGVSVQGDVVMAAGAYLLDIGAGSLTNEVTLVPEIPFSTDANEGIGSWTDFGVFPLENALAASSRLVARLRSNSATANSDIWVHVHGIK